MQEEECDICVFDKEKCYKCEFINKERVFGKPKKLKFYSVEYQELQAQRNKELHLI